MAKEGVITRVDGKASILVVEQDPLVLPAIGAVLNMQGHRVVLARQIKDALPHTQQETFDVMILSIDDADTGACFASALRESDEAAEIPVIFLVPSLPQESSIKLSQQGGVFSLLKPIEPDDLIELVDKVLWMPHVARGRLGNLETHRRPQADWISLPGTKSL
ncbi:MAG: response regulator [bacterium]|nr:response regulator [bacterium]